MNNPLEKLIEVIKTGSSAEVKEAQKKVEKFWHEAYIPKREEGRKDFLIFLQEIKKIEEIKDIDHQAYLINTLKWPLWAIGEENFEEWAEFILKYIQHPSGKIRQAVIKAADYLIMDIMPDLRFNFNRKISPLEEDRIKKNKNRFVRFVFAVERLLVKYDESKFHRYKYISRMPVSVYKSLQKLLVEVLLRNEYYEDLYQRFLASDISRSVKSILTEESLQKLLEKYKLSRNLTLEIIKDWIWNDEGESAMDASNRFQKKCFKYFSEIKNIDELNEVLQVFVGAWNHFPHKSLGGKSPELMVEETMRKYPECKKDTQKMPDFVVGNEKIPWNEYWAMIAEMERLQTPFKNWVKNDILPKYEQYLIKNFSAEIVKEYGEVARIFFERAMSLGFIEFNKIRKDFIHKEFPVWWQTHVLLSELTEEEVLSFLKELFHFLSFTYNIDIEKFGF